jgi:eukaryotic-like serine/threonine-protein kinase
MTSRALEGKLIAGRYHVLGILRASEASTVFDATDTRVGTRLEVEVVADGLDAWSPAARAIELRAELSAAIDHPAIVAPRDVGLLDDNSPFVVRPRREGESLDDRICLGGPLAPTDVVRVGLELLSALAAAHEKGLPHGAIAPEHVVVTERDGVLLRVSLDGFGVDAPTVDDHSTLGFSRLAFVAPERLDAATSAAGAPTVASDLFALAAVLHFAATGTSPETARRGAGAFGLLPVRVARTLLRAMHPEPEHRYASAQEMLGMFLALRDLHASSVPDDIMPATQPANPLEARFVREELTTTSTSTDIRRVLDLHAIAKTG